MLNPDKSCPNKLGLILSAGGARAAYQVGALRYMGAHFPQFAPTIFTGVSAGSINAAFMAQGEPMVQSTQKMYNLWEQLKFEEVLRTNFKTLFAVTQRVFADMFLSKVTRRLAFRSILDATPLSHTLMSHIHFWKIAKSIRAGRVDGLAVSTLDYRDGTHCTFFDSHDVIDPWIRSHRMAVRTAIRIRHVMASCAIPLLFEPVPIGNSFFGDGAVGNSFPFSPAIHLGASHILTIGLSSTTPARNLTLDTSKPPSMGLIAGAVLNSMFVDNLGADFETLCRINELAELTSRVRRIDTFIIAPSKDLGAIAQEHESEIPFHLRQLFKTASLDSSELGTIISYLMFTPNYIKALLDLGEADARERHDEIAAFLGSIESQQPTLQKTSS